jgi:hypothetical protein
VREQSTRSRDRVRQTILDRATADLAGGRLATGVRWWLKYIVLGRGELPFTHLYASSPLIEKVQAEQMLMDFAIWLATCRPSGRPVSARTIGKYISAVRSWHRRTFRTEICGDLDYSALNDIVKGLCRTVEQPPARIRYGVRTQDLARALRRYASGPTANDAMVAAALTTGFCGLLRGAEVGVPDSSSFDPIMHLTRADLSFRRRASGEVYAVIMVKVAKRPGARRVPLVLGGGGSMLDPVAALALMVARDPVPEARRASTPLLRWAGGGALRTAEVRALVQGMMRLLGLDPRRFGAHSLRIGGATAALAAGMSPSTIRAAGRWASDIYELYTRVSRDSAMRVATTVGSTPFVDAERSARFVDEELTTLPIEVPFVLEQVVDQEMIDDALLSDDDE